MPGGIRRSLKNAKDFRFLKVFTGNKDQERIISKEDFEKSLDINQMKQFIGRFPGGDGEGFIVKNDFGPMKYVRLDKEETLSFEEDVLTPEQVSNSEYVVHVNVQEKDDKPIIGILTDVDSKNFTFDFFGVLTGSGHNLDPADIVSITIYVKK